MDMSEFVCGENELPLDRLVTDGGLCSIFRTIACVGDSLSSGEFEATDENGENKTYHDCFEYSWGQYLARMAGCKVYNFSRGGMTANEYCEMFAEENGCWDREKACQAYILALGANDIHCHPLGSVEDIDLECFSNNEGTFAGYYAQIVQRYKQISPDAKFFFMTMPRGDRHTGDGELADAHASLLYELAGIFENAYVLDFRKYAPEYDEQFRSRFYLGGHLNPAGYLLTARMPASYIDYLIRKNPDDFSQVGFIGTPYKYSGEKI